MIKFVKLFELFILLSTATLTKAEQCGKGLGSCPDNLCCSGFGWCGSSSDYCGNNCQPEYGRCNIKLNNPNSGKNIVSLNNDSKSSNNSSASGLEALCKDSKLAKAIIVYYPEWKFYNFPPKDLPFNKLTHVNYAFADIDPNNFSIVYDTNRFKELVNVAHEKNVKVLMSVGGWTYSSHFSRMVSTSSNRSKFVKSVKSMLESSKADGVDIDWEYPGTSGLTNNFDAANDTPNLLKLLKEIRESIGKSKLISAAVSHNTFSVNHVPLTDLTQFASIFDYINIMSYDFNGSWSSKIAHQSSLYTTREDDSGFSLHGAVKNWKNAGFPAEKIVVGIPAYGRSWIAASSTNNGYLQRPANSFPKGDEEDFIDPVENSYSGIWKYKNIRKSILRSTFSKASDSWTRLWDSKSIAPYLFNKDTKQFITYDDPESVSVKADYVIENKLGGMMMWEIEEDTRDSELITTMYEKFIGLTCDKAKSNGSGNNKHIVNNGLELDLDGMKSSTSSSSSSKTSTTKTSTIKTSSSSTKKATPTNSCPKYQSYQCCKSCIVAYEDNYKWGVNNNNWCILTYDCIEKIKKCWSEAYGYSCCKKCSSEVVTRDDNKRWGVENGNWCGIPKSC